MHKAYMHEVLKFILDTIFPIECIGCKKEGKWICDECFSKIELMEAQHCPICNDESELGMLCEKCEGKSRVEQILVVTHYDDKIVARAIHLLKYKNIKDLALPLSLILAKYIKKLKLKNSLLIPIPLHKKKLRERGFNQTELIARKISEKLAIPLDPSILSKIKNTKSQMSLDPLTRRKNIKGAFRCDEPREIKGKTIILLDDVCTTSATLEECAKVIHLHKPKKIIAAVLARGR